jgi:hypothetical protein
MKLITRQPYPLDRLLAATCVVAAASSLAPATAAPPPRHAAQARPDVVVDFRTLAQQRPWSCEPLSSSATGSPWPEAQAACAWQNRLRRQSWSWSAATAPACVSRQARWWNWAQAALPPGVQRSVWDERWTARSMTMAVDGEQRVLAIRRDGKDQWQASEWRWNPNPRPATRRWQEGRWKQLLDAASQPEYRSAAPDSPDAARIRPVFRRLLGARPGEMNGAGMAFESSGLCLQASNPLPGQPKLRLSYSPNDSRLEQRAAMHLQLSRQYPHAKWLTQFKMLDMPANLPSGAKFLATWVEDGQIVGQLWMPTKGDANTVRVRLTARLPQHQDDAMAFAAKMKPVVEHELETIAVQWAAAYE